MELKKQVGIFYKVNYLLFTLTTLLFISVSISTLNSFKKYGYSYTFEVTINDVTKSNTHYVITDIIICFVFSLLVLTYMYNCVGWMEIKKILTIDNSVETEVVNNDKKK